MSITSLDGKRFAQMIVQGANNLSINAEMVDALNVFPVPDGDTGTNMNLSMSSGAKEVQKKIQPHIGQVAAALSRGLLMGARGNSGVILSQLFRGFSKSIENKAEITSAEFAKALEAGVDTAYRAVMKPVEGTILTVAKDAAKKAVEVAKTEDDLIRLMEAVLEEANQSLVRTPDLLPVLKEVGVVDSGGQGLVCVFEGFLRELKGEKQDSGHAYIPSMDELVKVEHHKSVQGFMDTADIKYGYCTEFMVKFEKEKLQNHPFSEETFRQDLSEHGDSLLVISDEDLVKVHIHAEEPGTVLNYAQKYGSLINMKIENMREQHSAILEEEPIQPQHEAKAKQQVDYSIVTVAMGEGIADLFKSIGATVVIEGGQTMNPSTEDIVEAIAEIDAKNVIILPNNKNIIMAAEQAANVVDGNVTIIPTKTVPQGLASLLAFHPSKNIKDNEKMMKEALGNVKTGQVTYAIRDTTIKGHKIAKNDYMGIADGTIVETGKDKIQTTKKLLQHLIDDESEILTIIYGEDITNKEVEAVQTYVEEHFADVEVEVHNGKQPLYSFIFSVE